MNSIYQKIHDKGENMQSGRVITEMAEISGIIRRFINSNFGKYCNHPSEERPYIKVLRDYIGKNPSFQMDDRSMGEILMFICNEDNPSSVKAPLSLERSSWFSHIGAEHCFYLAADMLHTGTFSEFMRIRFESLISYLLTIVSAEQRLGNISDETFYIMKNQLQRILQETYSYYGRYHEADADFAVVDLMKLAVKVGTRPWYYGVVPIATFAESVTSSYLVMKKLLIDGLFTTMELENSATEN